MYMDMPNKPTLYHKNQGVTVYNWVRIDSPTAR